MSAPSAAGADGSASVRNEPGRTGERHSRSDDAGLRVDRRRLRRRILRGSASCGSPAAMVEGHSRPRPPAREAAGARARCPRRRRARRAAAAHRPGWHRRAAVRRGDARRVRWPGRAAARRTRAARPVKGLGPAKRAEIAAMMELARRSLAERAEGARPVFDAPAKVKDYLRLQLGAAAARGLRRALPRCAEPTAAPRGMFRGTLTQTSVYPREVVKRALERPCGRGDPRAQPSVGMLPSRRVPTSILTQTLKSALALVDVRVLDHLVVGRAERRLVRRARTSVSRQPGSKQRAARCRP